MDTLGKAAQRWLDQVKSETPVLSRVHLDPTSKAERLITAEEDAPILELIREASGRRNYRVFSGSSERQSSIEETVPEDRYPHVGYRYVAWTRLALLKCLHENRGNPSIGQIIQKTQDTLGVLSHGSSIKELAWAGDPPPFHSFGVGKGKDGSGARVELIVCKTGGEQIVRAASSEVTPAVVEESWMQAGSKFPSGDGERMDPNAQFTFEDRKRFEWPEGVLTPRLWLPPGGVKMSGAPATFPVFEVTRSLPFNSQDGSSDMGLQWVLSHRNAGSGNMTIPVDGLSVTCRSPS